MLISCTLTNALFKTLAIDFSDLPPYSSYISLECYTIIVKKKIKNYFLPKYKKQTMNERMNE